MKKFTLITVLMLFLSTGIVAQKVYTTLVVNSHEICIADDNDEINITIYELDKNGRTTESPLFESVFVKKGDFSGTYKNVSYAFRNKVIKVEDDNVDVRVTSFYRNLNQAFPSVYFSHLGLLDGVFGNQPSEIKQRAGSFEWGLYFPATVFCTRNNHFGIATGLGISNSYNFFNNNYVLMNNNGDLYQQKVSDLVAGQTNGHDDIIGAGVTKSYLRYWSTHLPLTLQLQWKVSGNTMMLSAGCDLEWRFGMRSFARYHGSKHTMASDINYNPIGLNAIFQIGFANVNIISRFGLTEMFNIKESATSEDYMSINQWSIGIGFNID
ncbi:MAG: hypothetical protein ACI358_06890 [Candidatus Limimorpha sp.]